ncbi:MAG: hypothetical protein A2086_13795 [Spirochaetes bacterium GWD1_27_9]|nr:MAG: hypothetical protein A2Z98_08320 [Spirochaetes bacterium GWB1_27_13]OHD28246.1 MAG: hypothetical protein A2Y34_05690 [Spirochaetes bacterium GWC1_27_15]OHD40565.1 MAG: hypothetical protein A2086_13795 [Spirochaetes bacterium GWD1_27_9]
MFVGIAVDFVTDDSKIKVDQILKEYGLKKIQINLYESFEFPSKKLGNLKKDITECLDMDDKLRLYQFPLDDTFKISYIENRKWKRLSITQ